MLYIWKVKVMHNKLITSQLLLNLTTDLKAI